MRYVLNGPLKEYRSKKVYGLRENQIDRDNSNDFNKYSHKSDKHQNKV